MAVQRIVLDLDPDDRARLDAEGRRRGVEAGQVIVELVRSLPPAKEVRRVREVLAGRDALHARMPEIGRHVFERVLAADRAELEARSVPHPER